jgi:hypothetical protein
MKTLLAAVCVSALAIVSAKSVLAERIKWASKVTPDGFYRALNVPDFRYAPGGPYTVSEFGPVRVHGRLGSLSPALGGVTFRRGYLIAFEGNGGHGAGVSAGWESSIWTFADSRGSFRYFYNEKKTVADNNLANGRNAVLTSGPIGSPAYARFFGMCCSEGPANIMGQIVFDVRAMGINPSDRPAKDRPTRMPSA